MVNVILIGTVFDTVTLCSLVDIHSHEILNSLMAAITDI